MTNMTNVAIQFPILNESDILAIYAQVRPYRKNGYRIQMEKIQNKFLFHNYGHGGSGVSLSYGSALEIFSIFKSVVQQQNKCNQCAVLGSGIIGLMTALILVQNGNKVKIYSDKIPQFGQKNNQKMITSQVAPGFWFPYDYIDFQPKITRRIATNTYDFLSKCIKQKKFQAVQYAQVYQNIYSSEIYDKVLQKQMKDSFKKIELKFVNGQKQIFNNYRTIKIDMQKWINQVIILLKAKGVEFVSFEIKELKQVLSFRQKYIFNCLGNGAKQVFKDENMFGVKGHLIQFKNLSPFKYNFIFGTKINQKVIRIYCHKERIIIGLTSQKKEDTTIDQHVVDQLFKRVQGYFKVKSTLQAKL